MIRRVAILVGLIGYYVIQLAMLSKKQGVFMQAIEVLLLFSPLCSLLLLWFDYIPEKSIITVDGGIFGLSVGWLGYSAFSVNSSPVFFAINLSIALILLGLDIMAQKSRIETDVLDDLAREATHPQNISGKQRISDSGPSDADVGDIEDGRGGRDRNATTLSHISVELHDNNGEAFSSKHINVDNKGDDSIFDGFRTRLDRLPHGDPSIPVDVAWESFSCVEHRVDSSSCHIYTAIWEEKAVIVKLIKADRVTPIAISEFETEAGLLSRVTHPHIVKLLGCGFYPRRFLILELLDGGSLSHSLGLRPGASNKVAKRKFSYLETLILGRDLASALDYLHNNWHPAMHIIHRDLKPDNIGWTSNGTLKLFDFGLCACVRAQRDRREQYRMTGNTGTLRYMAPEVALGRAYNRSVDVYSFAIILWQVLKSRIPFREMGKKSYIENVIVGGKRPKLDKRWPERFRKLLTRCWHDDKELRPDFDEILRELDDLILEAQGLNRTNILLQIQLSARYLRSCASGKLRLARPFLAMCFLIVFVIAIALLSFGVQQSGSVCIIVSSAGLYVTGMSFIRGKSRPRTASNSLVGLELSPGRHHRHNHHNNNNHNQHHPHTSLPTNSPNSTHILAPPRVPGGGGGGGTKSIPGVKSTPAFNPLSPHSYSEDDSEEGTAAGVGVGVGSIDIEAGRGEGVGGVSGRSSSSSNSNSAVAHSSLRNRAAVAMGVSKVPGNGNIACTGIGIGTTMDGIPSSVGAGVAAGSSTGNSSSSRRGAMTTAALSSSEVITI